MNRLALLSLLAAGCVADSGDQGFVILNNLAPDTECSVTADRNAPFISRGTIWLSSPVPYLGIPLFESRISALEGQESQRTVALRGARVDVSVESVTVETEGTFTTTNKADLGTFTQGVKFASLFSAPLSPLGTATATVDLIQPSLLAEIDARFPTGSVRAQLVATVVAYGDLGGSEVESVPFVFPVTACSDCIVNNLGACSAVAKEFEPRGGNACNLFQDGIVDCCQGSTGLVCPAVGTFVPPMP